MKYEFKETVSDSLEKMLISVDKKFSNEVCRHFGEVDSRIECPRTIEWSGKMARRWAFEIAMTALLRNPVVAIHPF